MKYNNGCHIALKVWRRCGRDHKAVGLRGTYAKSVFYYL